MTAAQVDQFAGRSTRFAQPSHPPTDLRPSAPVLDGENVDRNLISCGLQCRGPGPGQEPGGDHRPWRSSTAEEVVGVDHVDDGKPGGGRRPGQLECQREGRLHPIPVICRVVGSEDERIEVVQLGGPRRGDVKGHRRELSAVTGRAAGRARVLRAPPGCVLRGVAGASRTGSGCLPAGSESRPIGWFRPPDGGTPRSSGCG